MQNSLNKERNIVEFASSTKVATDVMKGSGVSPMSKFNELPKTAQITPIKAKCVYVIKKDGTKEEFDNNKIINAVKKSATRMLVEFTDVELKEICDFVDENIVRMNKQEVTIRIPVHMLEKIRKYKRACSLVSVNSDMECDVETIAKLSGLDAKKINEVKSALKREPVSLDTYVTDDLCIQDYVEDTSYSSPENNAQKLLQQKDIVRLLKALDKREEEIIKKRFGIDNDEPRTLEQIGKALGFSKERIRQLENIAIQKLRKVEQVENLKTYLES
mgnify:CR=1 FL=1